ALRKIYGDYLNFLPSHLNDFKPEEVYLRSTDYARTFQSLQQLLKGTFPELTSKNTPDFAIRTRSHDDESLFPNWRCNELNAMIKRFVKTHRGDISKGWTELREDLISNVPELSEMLKKKEYESYLTIHQLFDSFISAKAHQLPLPKGLSDKHLRELEKLEVGLWFDMMIVNPEGHSADKMNSFMIGKLFGEVKDLMNSKVNASKFQPAPKLAIFSGHDTTIAPFLVSIKAFDNRWPAYGSMLMLELFKDTKKSTNPNPDHYVRVKYNQNVLNIPECAKPGNHHPELGKSYCKLDTVKKLFDKFIIDDFEGECKGFKPEMSAV
ncbi:phosphoglycerate mutase-like protein, partial [Conidiobolus coronatus NRRL 28638]